MTTKRSKYAARPITNGSSAAVAQAATQEFKRIEQVINDRLFPIPGGDGAYNAAAFPGATKEARITRMIAEAKKDGVPIGWIPYSHQPYDANAVTFDHTNVHLMREGGSTRDDEFEPEAYGAANNNSQDDYYACAAALSACAAFANGGLSGTGGGILRGCVGGGYRHSKPLLTNTTGQKIRGQGRSGKGITFFVPSYNFGPSIVATDSTNIVVPTTSGLTSGGGSALTCPQVNPGWWFNFRDVPAVDALNGASAFTVRGYFKMTTVVNNTWITGAWQVNDDTGTSTASVRCFSLRVSGTSLEASANIGGVQKTITGGTISAATTYYYSASYDGTTFRLYLAIPGSSGNAAVASTAASGTLTLQGYEEWSLGYGNFTGPGETSANLASFAGVHDSFEIANTARDTGSITAPDGKLIADSNSLLVVNWDEILGSCAKATNKDGTGWLWRRDRSINTSGFDDFEMTDCAIYGNNTTMGVIVDRNNHRPYFRRVLLQQVRSGILVTQRDSYYGHYEDLWIQGPFSGMGRYGLYFGGFDDGISHVKSVQFDGGDFTYPVMSLTAATYTQVHWLAGATYTRFCLIQVGSGSYGAADLTDCSMSTEAGVGSGFQGLIMANGALCSVVCRGGVYETSGGKPIIVNRSASVEFDRAVLKWTGSAPTTWMASLALGTTPGAVATFSGCPQTSGIKPLSDVAGTAVVGKIGKGSAITFSATPTFDASLRDSFEITLTGNITSLTMSNMTPGQEIDLHFIQDATGGRTVAQPSSIKGVLVIDTRPSAISKHRGMVGLDGNLYLEQERRIAIPGFLQDNVAASQTDVELTNAIGRWQAPRPGCLTAIVVHATEARTAGTLTVEVYKNTGLAGAAGSQLGTLSAVLNATDTSKKTTVQDTNADTFNAGDELYAVVTTDGSWTPTTSDIRVTLEVAM